MFPSKSMEDYMHYMNEMDRLVTRTSENDYLPLAYSNKYDSPISHPALANRSSSSTDFNSPESYNSFISMPSSTQDLYRHERNIPETPRAIYEREDIPFHVRRQRPIVGRKLMSNQDHMLVNYDSQASQMKTDRDFEVPNYTWQPDDSLIHSQPENDTKNKFYELFPAENKGFEFWTSAKTPNSNDFNLSRNLASTSPSMTNMSSSQSTMSLSFTNHSTNVTKLSQSLTYMSTNLTNMSPNRTNMSPNPTKMLPNPSNISPNLTNMSLSLYNVSPKPTNMSPNMNFAQKKYSPPNFPSHFSSPIPHNMNKATYGTNLGIIPQRFQQEVKEIKNMRLCTFCRKNGETSMVYTAHSVKKRVGNRHVVTCPILRSHRCPRCGVSGDDAHTITYCPILRRRNNGLPIPSTTVIVKNTRLMSNGRRRY